MKKSQQPTITATDDFEDLTLFANESFDTQDVDLFEFTSEESSPLTRLKSIILSLDWEINDEILQELADELDNLQSMWQGDKVAEVYLQGLSKIGSYIRTKGAYAHPNSIKLLLTFFYNFEKIISSEQITGEQITQLLKGDIRKFKILQYQINQSEDSSIPPVESTFEPSPPTPDITAPSTEPSSAKQLKAAILSLDWEVTNDSLAQFHTTLASCHQLMADNKPALVLLQGLQALGDYIAEERADAHPEAFTLLHSFNEGLEQVTRTDGQRLDQASIQDLLVDRVNRLNTLKMLITAPVAPPVDEHFIDEVVEEISTAAHQDETASERPSLTVEASPVDALSQEALTIDRDLQLPGDASATDDLEAEIDTLFALNATPAMETADLQYPDEILPPEAIHPVDDELADDFIEAHLSANRGLMPALSDIDGQSEYPQERSVGDLPMESDLAEQLDVLFAETDGQEYAEPASSSVPLEDGVAASEFNENEPIAALADIDIDEQAPFGTALPTEDLFVLEAEESDHDQQSLDIEGTLDKFFAEGEEEPQLSMIADTVDEEFGQPLAFEEEGGLHAALTDIPARQGAEQEEPVLSFEFAPADEISFDEHQPIVALADAEPPPDQFALEASGGEDDQNSLDLQNKLDSFFADVAEEPAETVAEEPDGEAIEQLTLADQEISPSALADIPEELGFEEEETPLEVVPIAEIEEKLDFFFGTEAEEPDVEGETSLDAALASMAETAPAITPALQEIVSSAVPEEEEGALAAIANVDLPETELEEALDLFFDAEQEETKKELEPLAADELTEALEAATLGDGVIGTLDDDKQMHLAALGALLPLVVRTPSREKMAEAAEMIATLHQAGLSSEQTALLRLLESVVSMLMRLPAHDNAATEKLVNYLYEQLLRPSCPPDVLPNAINRFTGWLQQASSLMPLVPAVTASDEGSKEQEPSFTYTAKDLYFELAALRGQIKEEFANVRHALKHHH